MIKKLNRSEVEYVNSVERMVEFLLGEYILYLSMWKAYDLISDEFNNRRSFWVTILTLFSIIFISVVFIAAICIIINFM